MTNMKNKKPRYLKVYNEAFGEMSMLASQALMNQRNGNFITAHEKIQDLYKSLDCMHEQTRHRCDK